MRVIKVVGELFFSTKITEVCKTLGVEHCVARSKERLEILLAEEIPSLVLLDLGIASGDGTELASVALTYPACRRIVGFYSHTADDLRQSALGIGMKEVLPRSRFFVIMPEIIQESLASEKQRGSVG